MYSIIKYITLLNIMILKNAFFTQVWVFTSLFNRFFAFFIFSLHFLKRRSPSFHFSVLNIDKNFESISLWSKNYYFFKFDFFHQRRLIRNFYRYSGPKNGRKVISVSQMKRKDEKRWKKRKICWKVMWGPKPVWKKHFSVS